MKFAVWVGIEDYGRAAVPIATPNVTHRFLLMHDAWGTQEVRKV